MKTAIYYFSGTGNTLEVARDLARELGAEEIIPIVKALKSGAAAPYDTIGIVFPVYMFGLPLIVAEFLRKLDAPKDAYIFAVANFGGIPGRSLTLVKNILAGRLLRLAAGFGILMPGNYTPLYGAIPEENQKVIFEKEKVKVRNIAGAVRGRKSGIIEESPLILNLLLYLLFYRIGSSQIRQEDRGFWVNEKCTKCGLCEKICPAADIVMRDGHPVWLHHCEHCMACLQWCPVEAIQYKKRTSGRKRYHHPEVKAADIMAQKLI